jgi:hypothetical protein
MAPKGPKGKRAAFLRVFLRSSTEVAFTVRP